MSRKNKILRAFLHQNQNPTIEQAWDAAWKHAQKTFHARSMRDMEEKLEIERDYNKALVEALEMARDRLESEHQDCGCEAVRLDAVLGTAER